MLFQSGSKKYLETLVFTDFIKALYYVAKDAVLMQVMNSLLELLQCTMLHVQESHLHFSVLPKVGIKVKINVMLNDVCECFFASCKEPTK